jgi:hypothetical protein
MANDENVDDENLDNPSLEDLIEEFLDYCQYFGMPSGGASLSFNTRIQDLEREVVREIIEQFVKYANEANKQE